MPLFLNCHTIRIDAHNITNTNVILISIVLKLYFKPQPTKIIQIYNIRIKINKRDMSPRQELDFKNKMVIAGIVRRITYYVIFLKYVNAMLSTKVWHPLNIMKMVWSLKENGFNCFNNLYQSM